MLTLIVFFLGPNAILEKARVLSIQFLRWLKNGDICGALFADLCKAFDCLVHDFLLAKLEAYGCTPHLTGWLPHW